MDSVTKDRLRRNCYIYIGWVAIAGVFLLLFSPYTTVLNDYYGYDTAIWHVIGKGIVQGLVPYRDLFDHKGPLLFFIYAFSWLFEKQRLAMFLMQWCAFSVTVCYLYRIALLFVNKIKAGMGVFFFLFLFCGTVGEGAMSEEWCLPFIVITLFYALRYVKNQKQIINVPMRHGFLYGLCFGIVAMIRLNNAAIICGVVLTFIILLIAEKDYISVLKNAIAFVIGAMIPIVIIAIWFFKRDALDYLWWGAFAFNFKYAVNGSEIQTLWGMIRPWLMQIPVVLCEVMLYIRWKQSNKNVGYLMIGISFAVTSIVLMLGASFFHYYTIILPLYMIAFCLFIEKPLRIKNMKWNFAIISVLVLAIPFTWQSARNAGKGILLNTQGWYDKQHAEIREFMAQIPETERDSVWGNGSSFSKVYCIAGITPCFSFFDNGNIHYQMDATMNTKTEEMFQENPPKWIVVATVGEPKIEALEKNIYDMYELYDVSNGEKYLELYRLKN